MNPRSTFHRISIDVDTTGGPVGLSVESFDDDSRVALVVLERPGPFDTVADCLMRGVAYVDSLYGRQLELPL